MIKSKKLDFRILIFIISLVCMFVFGITHFLIQKKFSDVASVEECVDQCYVGRITPDLSVAILDSGHARILKVNQDSYVEKLIIPDGFVDNMILGSDGSVWTNESLWDGMWVSDEYIYHYVGDDKEEIAHFNYGEKVSNKHKIFGLNINDEYIRYAICEANRIRAVTQEGKVKRESIITYDNALNAIADLLFDGDNMYILDNCGEIYVIDLNNKTNKKCIYSVKVSEKEKSRVPYAMTLSEDKEIYFTDIRNRSVQKVVENELTESITVIPETDSPTISVSKYEGNTVYILSEPEGLRLKMNDDVKIIQNLKFHSSYSIIKGIIKVLHILFIISVVLFVIFAFRIAILKLTSTRLLIMITMILSVCVSGLLIYMLLNKFTDTYKENIYSQLEISAFVVSNRISTKDIENINYAEDYKTDSYKRIADIMIESYPLNVPFNKNLYCNIMKMDKNGEPCAIAYLDQSIGVYYPLDSEEKEEVKSVYETKKSLWNDAKADISGTYLYVKVPIFDDFEVVKGCVAVGLPLEVLTDSIQRIRTEIFAASIVILLLLFIAISEISKIIDYKSLYDKDITEGVVTFPGHIFMILIILVFSAYNMSSTFLPIYILKRLPAIEFNKELLASIPITINIFIIGVMSLFCSKLIKRFGIRNILSFTAIFSIIGNVILFINQSYFGIFVGLILDGIGVGIITNTCYIIITYLKDEVFKTEGFTIYNSSCLAGINVGMLLGSIIAVNCDYNYVFLFVIIVWVFVIFAALSLYKNMLPLFASKENVNMPMKKNRHSFAKFIGSHKINLFFIFMQNPAIVFNSFVYYFIPIYCDNNGYSATIVSILFIIYTEIAVLTGDRVLHYLTHRLHDKTMYIGIFINILAVLTYGILNNIVGIIIALCLLGFAAGFLKPSLQNYFISLKEVKKYGEDDSMGIYNFTENIGESLGPTIFSQLMAFSPMLISIIPFTAIVGGMGMLHLVFNRDKLKGREHES